MKTKEIRTRTFWNSLLITLLLIAASAASSLAQAENSVTAPLQHYDPGEQYRGAPTQRQQSPRQFGVTGNGSITTAMPGRPRDKQGRYLAGSGVALAQVNPKTGGVISIRMLQSTGHKELDEFAITQLRAWKAKPGTPSTVRIPVTFNK